MNYVIMISLSPMRCSKEERLLMPVQASRSPLISKTFSFCQFSSNPLWSPNFIFLPKCLTGLMDLRHLNKLFKHTIYIPIYVFQSKQFYLTTIVNKYRQTKVETECSIIQILRILYSNPFNIVFDVCFTSHFNVCATRRMLYCSICLISSWCVMCHVEAY